MLLHAHIRILGILLCVSVARAMEPSDPFWSGWRVAIDFPAVTGIAADGQTIVVWSTDRYRHSRDAGITWSDPLMAPGGTITTAPILQAVVVGRSIWLRLADGVVMDTGGRSVNTAVGGAITRMATDGSGTLYADRGDGRRVAALIDGTVVADSSGRMEAVLTDGVVVTDGSGWWRLGRSGTVGIRGPGGEAPGPWPLQTGTIAGSWRDAGGTGWAVRDGGVRHTGALRGVEVLSMGTLGDEELALLRVGDRIDITTARPGALLRSGAWATGMPPDLVAVAGTTDPAWPETRRRMVAVGGDRVWVWRSR